MFMPMRAGIKMLISSAARGEVEPKSGKGNASSAETDMVLLHGTHWLFLFPRASAAAAPPTLAIASNRANSPSTHGGNDNGYQHSARHLLLRRNDKPPAASYGFENNVVILSADFRPGATAVQSGGSPPIAGFTGIRSLYHLCGHRHDGILTNFCAMLMTLRSRSVLPTFIAKRLRGFLGTMLGNIPDPLHPALCRSPMLQASPAVPRARRVEGTQVPCCVFDSNRDLARFVAQTVAGIIRQKNAAGSDTPCSACRLGSTPVGVYRELIRILIAKRGSIFRHVITFNLDEYFGRCNRRSCKATTAGCTSISSGNHA